MMNLRVKRKLRTVIILTCLLVLFMGVLPSYAGYGAWTKVSSSGLWIVDVDTLHASEWSADPYYTSWFAYYDNFQCAHFSFKITSGSNDSHLETDFFSRWSFDITNDEAPSSSTFVNFTIEAGLHMYQKYIFIFLWPGPDHYYNWGSMYDNGSLIGEAKLYSHGGPYYQAGPDLCDPSKGDSDTDVCNATWAPTLQYGGDTSYRELTVHLYMWRNTDSAFELLLISPYINQRVTYEKPIGSSTTAWDLNMTLNVWNDYGEEFYQDPYEARGDPTGKHYATILFVTLDTLLFGSNLGIEDPSATEHWGILEPLRAFFIWALGILQAIIPQNLQDVIGGYLSFFWEMVPPVMEIIIWVGANWMNLFLLMNMILVVFGANEAMKSGDPRVFIMPIWNFWMGCIRLMMSMLNLALKVVDIIIPF